MLRCDKRVTLMAIVGQALRHQSSHIWGFGDCDVSINFELSAKVSGLSAGRECCVRNPKLPGTRIETLGVDAGAYRIVLAVVPLCHVFGRPIALCLQWSCRMVACVCCVVWCCTSYSQSLHHIMSCFALCLW
jgi:hypothetical protein